MAWVAVVRLAAASAATAAARMAIELFSQSSNIFCPCECLVFDGLDCGQKTFEQSLRQACQPWGLGGNSSGFTCMECASVVQLSLLVRLVAKSAYSIVLLRSQYPFEIRGVFRKREGGVKPLRYTDKAMAPNYQRPSLSLSRVPPPWLLKTYTKKYRRAYLLKTL